MKPLRIFLTSLLFMASLHAVEIVAHRGASHDAPENTLASEKLAWKQNADAVETDIWLTKDGKLIVSHDKSAKRATGRELSMTESTLEELRELDAGKWKGEQFAGEKLPTLDEQIALIPPRKKMFVEIKDGPHIVPELKRCLERTKQSPKTITIISFNYESLKECRKLLPGYKTQYLVGYRAPNPKKAPAPDAKKQPTLDEIIAEAKAAKLTGLDLQSTWPLTPADTKKIKDAGLELHVWTVDDPAVAKHWIELGAISVTTNRPGFLREQLKL
jgi:glycerophosphoryl diester phosphodiesterase